VRSVLLIVAGMRPFGTGRVSQADASRRAPQIGILRGAVHVWQAAQVTPRVYITLARSRCPASGWCAEQSREMREVVVPARSYSSGPESLRSADAEILTGQ